jgi:hypothetical protein
VLAGQVICLRHGSLYIYAILNSIIGGFARILLPAPELRCGKPILGVTVTSGQERHLLPLQHQNRVTATLFDNIRACNLKTVLS